MPGDLFLLYIISHDPILGMPDEFGLTTGNFVLKKLQKKEKKLQRLQMMLFPPERIFSSFWQAIITEVHSDVIG